MKFSVLTPSIRPEFLDITQETLEKQTFQDFEWIVEVGLRNRGHSLNKDLNKMLKRSKGDQIIMLQDCIRIEEHALERIAKLNPSYFFTFPVGKVLKWEDMPLWDWRKKPESLDIQPHYWEADFATAPRKAFFDIGGYDEEFDNGWSWENVALAWRAYFAGYRFMVEPNIPSIAIDHDKIKENPWRGKLVNNTERSNEAIKKAERGNFRLNYL
jgi:GT2 family glycosyltransferase